MKPCLEPRTATAGFAASRDVDASGTGTFGTLNTTTMITAEVASTRLRTAVAEGLVSDKLHDALQSRAPHEIANELEFIAERNRLLDVVRHSTDTFSNIRVKDGLEDELPSIAVAYLVDSMCREHLLDRLRERLLVTIDDETRFRGVPNPAEAVEQLRGLLDESDAYLRKEGLVPPVETGKLLTLPEICERENVSLSELEGHVREKFQRFEKLMRGEYTHGTDKHFVVIDLMYQLFEVSRSPSTDLSSAPWLSNFETFEGFVEHFTDGSTPNSRCYMARHIEAFMSQRIRHSGIVHFQRNSDRPGDLKTETFYSTPVTWIPVPEDPRYPGRHQEFAALAVIVEAIELVRAGTQPPDYSHSTGSAALPGILRHREILSGRAAIKRGEPILTGEYFTAVASDTGIPEADGESGLRSVYADEGGPCTSYTISRWFTEFPVTFGISAKLQAEHLATLGMTPRHPGEPVFDAGPEGVTLGPSVPLANVTNLYGWHSDKDRLEAWVTAAGIEVPVTSYEAMELVRRFPEYLRRLCDDSPVTIPKIAAGLKYVNSEPAYYNPVWDMMA